MTVTDNICLLTRHGKTEMISVGSDMRQIIVSVGDKITLSVLVLSGEVSLKIVLAGEGASCRLTGLYLAGGDVNSRIRFDVVHQAGNTRSEQVVKGIVTDKAAAAFEGVIRIPRNSQHCDAVQNHRAVVLSDKAAVTAIPELEICADDVVCAHGSAIGALDESQVFYLMSRGVSEAEAKKILLRAFVTEVSDSAFETEINDWMAHHV